MYVSFNISLDYRYESVIRLIIVLSKIYNSGLTYRFLHLLAFFLQSPLRRLRVIKIVE